MVTGAQEGGKGGRGQNISQAFELQPLAHEVIFHVFSVSTQLNISLMLNMLKSRDEPSGPERQCSSLWGCRLGLEWL